MEKSSYSWELTETDRRVSKIKEEYYKLTEREKLEQLRMQFSIKFEKMRFSDKPKIFIYTPTYNRAQLLKDRALKSILSQTYDNWEYLVVGDGCNDDTEKVVNETADERVHYYNITQRGWRYPPSAENHWLVGPVVAANTALKLVNGDWIARLDDDDIWVEDHLEVMLKAALDGKYEFVSGQGKEMRDGIESVIDGEYLLGGYFGLTENDDITNNPKIGGISTILYRSYLRYFEFNPDCYRKSINRVNDLDFLVRFGQMGVNMGFVDRVETITVPRPGTTTVGSDAYRRDVENVEKMYMFSEEPK